MESITVAICTYNRGESGFLQQAIASVIDQTYKNIEILVFDNGSTDNTFQVVSEFCDSRLKYIKNPINERSAFNRIIDLCQTDLLVIFHDDDVMLPNMIETEIKAMRRYPEAAMIGQIGILHQIDAQNNTINIIKKPRLYRHFIQIFKQNEFIQESMKYGGNLYCFPTVMFRIAELNKHHLRFDTDCGPLVDWLFWLQINYATAQILGIHKPLIKYRVHSNNDTNYCQRTGLWDNSHKYVENWLLSIGYKCPNTIIDNFIISSLCISYNNCKTNQEYVLSEHVKKLEEKYGWRCFNCSFIAYVLTSSLIYPGCHVTFKDYLKQKKYITRELNTKLYWHNELKLIVKYIYYSSLRICYH